MENCLKIKLLSFVLLTILVASISSCNNGEERREAAIKEIMNKSIADISSYEGVETVYMDSIQPIPCDSICLFQAYETYNKFEKAALSWGNFTKVFRENKSADKTYDLDVNSMNDIQKSYYSRFFEDLREFVLSNEKLKKRIKEYKPYAYKRVMHRYRYKNDAGKFVFGIGRFYFNKKDELERYILMDDSINTHVFGVLDFAKDDNNSRYIDIFRQVGFNTNEQTLGCLRDNPETPIKYIIGIEPYPETQVVQQSTINQSTTEDVDYYNTTAHSQINNRSDNNSLNTYVVTKKCGAAISKEAEKRFTKYSVNGDTDGINRMLLNGELIVLQSGDEVIMLDLGYSISQVRTSSGQTVYVDTEFLSKR